MGNQESNDTRASKNFSTEFISTRFWKNQPVIAKRSEGSVSHLHNRTRIRHPHILSTLAVENGELIFETTPEDLSTLLKKGTLGENDMLAFLRGSVSALAHLQTQGISHGYLIPQTIFHEQRQGAFKIYDQELLNGKSFTLQAAKSRQKCYIAPELLEMLKTGNMNLDEYGVIKADVFSFGMIAIEAGTGLNSSDCFNFNDLTINYEIIDKRLAILRERFSIQIAHTIKLMIMPYLIFRPDFVDLMGILVNNNPGRVNVPVQPYNPNRVVEMNKFNPLQSGQQAIAFIPNIYSNNLPIQVANENNYMMEMSPSNTEFLGNEMHVVNNPNLDYMVIDPVDNAKYQVPVNLDTIPKNAYYENKRPTLNLPSQRNSQGTSSQSFIRTQPTISQRGLQSPKLNPYSTFQESPYERIKEKISNNVYHVENKDVLLGDNRHARPFSVEKHNVPKNPVSYNITINNFANSNESKLGNFYSPGRGKTDFRPLVKPDRDMSNTFPVKAGPRKSLEDRLDSVLDRSQKLMDKIKSQIDRK